MLKAIKILPVVFGVLMWATAAPADTIYNTVGQNQGFSTGGGYVLCGSAACSESGVAIAFTTNVAYYLQQIDFYTQNTTNPLTATNFVLDLLSDAGGTPGSVIHSWGFPNAQPGIDTVGGVSANGPTNSLGVTLNAGTQYWVSIDAAGSTVPVVWDYSTESILGTVGLTDNGSSWSMGQRVATGLDVQGYPVLGETPEPTTLLLFAAGLVCGLSLVKTK
jgi:hypothetical protein